MFKGCRTVKCGKMDKRDWKCLTGTKESSETEDTDETEVRVHGSD